MLNQSREALNRLSQKHNEEWNEILTQSEQALESARTVKEINSINKQFKRKLKELRKKKKEEVIQLQKEYIDKLLSL